VVLTWCLWIAASRIKLERGSKSSRRPHAPHHETCTPQPPQQHPLLSTHTYLLYVQLAFKSPSVMHKLTKPAHNRRNDPQAPSPLPQIRHAIIPNPMPPSSSQPSLIPPHTSTNALRSGCYDLPHTDRPPTLRPRLQKSLRGSPLHTLVARTARTRCRAGAVTEVFAEMAGAVQTGPVRYRR
jgi:hypothetical protein